MAAGGGRGAQKVRGGVRWATHGLHFILGARGHSILQRLAHAIVASGKVVAHLYHHLSLCWSLASSVIIMILGLRTCF